MKFYSEIARKPMDFPSLKKRVEEWLYDAYSSSDVDHESVEIEFGTEGTASFTSIKDITKAFLTIALYNPDLESSEFVSRLNNEALKGTGWRGISAENDYDYIRVTIHAPRERTAQILPKPRYLYHVTSEKNEARISRRGLVPSVGPRDRNRPEYTSRVYFLVIDFAVDDFSELIDYGSAIGGVRSSKDVVIFELDTKKFNKFNIFLDEELRAKFPIEAAVWTPTHIPPKALEVVYRASEDEMYN